ncbi:MAG: ABC transporter permease [Actinobacteria bacterium]|nr:ABC transporter permease [Actinomycetota bacterium]
MESSTTRRNFERAQSLGHYLVTPLFLGLVLLALYLYISGRTLDSIEQRSISSTVITTRTIEHIQLTAVSTALVVLLAVPMGILLTRPAARRFTPAFLAVANIGQATPSIGLLVLFAIVWTIGFTPAVVALVTYAFLPILRNTMVGLEGVDRSLMEAGQGMGMSRGKVLRTIELPLAVPVILAGIRTALVFNVGTAALAWASNAGGLGDIIQTGISTRRDPVLITGAVLTSALALFIDWLGGIAEDKLRPKGL